MLQPLGNQAVHMAVIQRIKHVLALFARLYQFCRAQQPELMRNGRRSDIQCRRNVANAQLPKGQGMQYSHAGPITQEAEDFGQICRRVVIQQRPLDLRYTLVMDARLFADVKLSEII